MTIARQPFEIAAEAHIEQAFAQVRGVIQPHVNQFRQRLQSHLSQAGEPSEVSTVELHAWMRSPSGGNVNGLVHVVRGAMSGFADEARGAVENGQKAAIEAGNAAGEQQVRAAVAPIAQAGGISPDELVKTTRADASYGLIGNTVSGGPLKRLFDTLPDDAANGMYQSLLSGLRAGVNPTQLAFDMMLWSGSARARALTIARTEMLGAYRTAQLENFRANSDVVGQWQWRCEIGSNTCAMCLGMDGEVFDLEESFDSHPNCRCSPEPVTKSWDDILGDFGIDTSDIPETSASADDGFTGAEWFAAQTTDVQAQVLGKAGAAAYAAGDVTLDDFIGIAADGSRYQRSLKDMGIDWRDYTD